MKRRVLSEWNFDIRGRVLPLSEFKVFLDAPNGLTVPPENREPLIKRAEEATTKTFPPLIASDFMMFKRDGNRSIYESKYFPRRGELLSLVVGEYLEKQGRFIDKIIDLAWTILEETTWVLPAHNPNKTKEQICVLPYAYQGKVDYIDLFSAATGADMAWVYYLLKDELDKVSPLVCERIKFELDRRIIDPFMDPECEYRMGWMGVAGNGVNNWNPWILSNVLAVCALTVDDTALRERLITRAMPMLDNFTAMYKEDGGCDEGPGYWDAAGAALFDCLQILYDMTDGYVDVFKDPLIKNMGEYEIKVCINGNRFLNFADCPSKVNPDAPLLLRWGRLSDSEMMYTFGVNRLNGGPCGVGANGNHAYRFFRNIVEPVHEKIDFVAPTKFWLDGIAIAGSRETNATDKGLYLAFKGGCNAESHNHNDVGTITVFADGQPIFLDAGSGRYTRRTFSAERYTIWAMRSDYHNCATVNGQVQRGGRNEYSCEHVYDPETGGLAMQLKNAYPIDAKIESYVRTAVLHGGRITVNDKIDLAEEGSVDFHFICNMLPENVTDTTFMIHGRTVTFSDKLGYNVEPLDKTWPEVEHIPKGWDCDILYRVTLKSKNNFKNGTFTLTVS